MTSTKPHTISVKKETFKYEIWPIMKSILKCFLQYIGFVKTMARDLHDGSWILVYVKHFDARSPGTERKMVSVWQMLFSKN